MTDGLSNGGTLVTSDDERTPHQKRLAEVAARRAEIAARREQRAAEREKEDELGEAERALADEEAIEKYEIEIGPVGRMIAVVETPLGAIIVKRPHAATYRRFQDRESKKSKDVEDFVTPCRVYPERAAFDRILTELPGTLTRCANAAAALAGVRNEEVSEK